MVFKTHPKPDPSEKEPCRKLVDLLQCVRGGKVVEALSWWSNG